MLHHIKPSARILTWENFGFSGACLLPFELKPDVLRKQDYIVWYVATFLKMTCQSKSVDISSELFKGSAKLTYGFRWKPQLSHWLHVIFLPVWNIKAWSFPKWTERGRYHFFHCIRCISLSLLKLRKFHNNGYFSLSLQSWNSSLSYHVQCFESPRYLSLSDWSILLFDNLL